MRSVCLLFVLLLAQGCGHLQSGAVCPQIRDFSLEEQRAQAKAETKLPKNSPLIDPLLEWASLREQLRVCHGEK